MFGSEFVFQMHLYEELDSDEQFQEIVHLMPSAARAQASVRVTSALPKFSRI